MSGYQKKEQSIRSFDFSKGVGNRYKLQSIGNTEVTVEGCKGIMKYEKEEILLNAGNGLVKISGRNLSIPTLEQNCVQIEGYIINIEFL